MFGGAALRGRPCLRVSNGWGGPGGPPLQSSKLELEAGGELHLALAEERAVCAGDVEERIGSDAVERQRRTGQVGNRSVNHRHLGAVEDVETFRQHFQLHLLSETEASRKSRVNVPNVRLLEEVSRH